MVPWGSPGKYSMIDCFLWDAFRSLFCSFWSTVAVWCSAADTHLKFLDHVVSGACFSLLIINLWQYYVCCIHNNLCTPFMVLYLCCICQCIHAHRYTYVLLAAEPSSTAGLSFPFQNLCGTNLSTLYSMVWDWWVSRAGQCFILLDLAARYFFGLLFPLSLLSFYRLVLWGWSLRSDRM